MHIAQKMEWLIKFSLSDEPRSKARLNKAMILSNDIMEFGRDRLSMYRYEADERKNIEILELREQLDALKSDPQ